MNFFQLVERLAEMFPKQDYNSRLEDFINSKKPESIVEIERLYHDFENGQGRSGVTL